MIEIFSKLALSNFKNFNLKAVLINDSSGTEILNPADINMVELGPNGAVILIPPKQCTKGQRLSLFINFDGKTPRVQGHMGGRVIKNAIEFKFRVLETHEEKVGKKKKGLVYLSLSEDLGSSWGKILSLILQRQTLINDLRKFITG